MNPVGWADPRGGHQRVQACVNCVAASASVYIHLPDGNPRTRALYEPADFAATDMRAWEYSDVRGRLSVNGGVCAWAQACT